METCRLTEPLTSKWSAPIAVVEKKDGTLQLCVDYRQLNNVTRTDAYPMPRIDELLDRVGHAQFITILDLTQGNWQVPVAEELRPKTAFTTPRGLYQFTRLLRRSVWQSGWALKHSECTFSGGLLL